MKIEVEGPEPKPAIIPEEQREPEEIPRMPGLVQIAAALQVGMDYLEASAEDMDDEQFNRLAETEGMLHEKIANYGTALKIHKRESEHFKAQAKVLKDMAAELDHKAKMIENAAERKKQRLKEVMERFAIKKVKGPHATVYLSDGSDVLKVENEALALEALPEEFIVTARAIDKKPLLAALQDKAMGLDLVGCGVSVGKGGTSINLR